MRAPPELASETVSRRKPARRTSVGLPGLERPCYNHARGRRSAELGEKLYRKRNEWLDLPVWISSILIRSSTTKKNSSGKRRADSSTTKLFPSSKNTVAREHFPSTSCRSLESWDFLARACRDMVARECPTLRMAL